MSSRLWCWLMAMVATVVAIVAVGVAWRAERRDQARLASELAATKTALQTAEERQQERDAKLAVTLEQIAAEKRTVQSPAQIAAKLPAIMQLPVAISLREALEAPALPEARQSNIRTEPPDIPQPKADTPESSVATDLGGEAVVPSPDLKAMYNFALDCQACRAKLAAVQSDLTDERLKSSALTKERDEALRIARGGSFLRRMRTACRWLLIGAAAGAVAARVAH